MNQKVGLSVLQKLGYRADIANNGLEVLQALDQKVYDLLFLDVQMPRDGWVGGRAPDLRAVDPGAPPGSHCHDRQCVMGDREKCLRRGWTITFPSRLSGRDPGRDRTMGTAKASPFDTRILLRTKAAASSELLDEAIVSRLRASAVEEAAPERALVLKFLEAVPQQLAHLARSREDSANLLVAVQQLKVLSIEVGTKRMVTVCEQLEEPGAPRRRKRFSH